MINQPTPQTARGGLAALACVSLLSLLSACGGVQADGYYDADGNFISTASPHRAKNSSHYTRAGMPDDNQFVRDYDDDRHEQYRDYDRDYRRGYNSNYNRHGYDDRNDDYIARNSNTGVPENMLPPRGMCRVWFTHRMISDQPAVQSCKSIKSRVPAGAFVIYGG